MALMARVICRSTSSSSKCIIYH